MKNVGLILLSVVVIVCIVFQCTKKDKADNRQYIKIDTVYVVQVVRDTIPKLVTTKKKEVIVDTLYSVDSILIPILLPMEKSIYNNELITSQKDTIEYRAAISGYKASFDSIDIKVKYRQYDKLIITNRKGKTWKDNFKIGIQVGYGYGLINRKSDVYAGVGVSYVFDI